MSQKNIIYSKIVSVEEAVSNIPDNATVATGGFCGSGFAEGIAIGIKEYFVANSKPRNLSLLFAAGQGDWDSRGLNHLGLEGLVKGAIGGHWGAIPRLQQLALDEKIFAYNLPQGVISHMYRDIAAGKPRTITKVGLGTFVDPRNDGGKINKLTREDVVELVEFDGQEYLAYKTRPVDVAILRGTTADTRGNITMEKEALTLDNLSMAMAAKNSGGIVIIQVERIAEAGSLNPREVQIPGVLVDYVVVASPDDHWQTYAEKFNPAYNSDIRVPTGSVPPLEMGVRKVLSRRAALELECDSVVNLGVGMPEGVSVVAAEEGVGDLITLTAEAGVIGGLPAGGLSFGAAVNAEAVIPQASQFDFYDGGGLDITFLGLAQADRDGNLNVSKFGTKMTGAGGFINISQNAKKVVYMGTFTAVGLEVEIKDGKLSILQEGKVKKLVETVQHITFSGKYAAKNQQPVLYVTERCVFSLCEDGLELVEIAPGIDLEKDILAQMEFKPLIKGKLKLMDARIFRDEPMGLSSQMV